MRPLHSALSVLPRLLLRGPCHSSLPFLLGSPRSAWEEAREQGSHCWRWDVVTVVGVDDSWQFTICPLVFQSLDMERNVHTGKFSLPKYPPHQTQSLPIHEALLTAFPSLPLLYLRFSLIWFLIIHHLIALVGLFFSYINCLGFISPSVLLTL